MNNTYDEFRSNYDSDEAAARAAVQQLLEVTGWGNAAVLQLKRLRQAVDVLTNEISHTIVYKAELNAWNDVERIMTEPEPSPVDIQNHFTEMVKDLQCQVRELEVANAGLHVKMADATATGIDLASERLETCSCRHCGSAAKRLADYAEEYRQEQVDRTM